MLCNLDKKNSTLELCAKTGYLLDFFQNKTLFTFYRVVSYFIDVFSYIKMTSKGIVRRKNSRNHKSVLTNKEIENPDINLFSIRINQKQSK